MRPKDCAYIVEHLSVRFMAMVADHSRQLAEHRAAFGARTEADRKIIAGLREESAKCQAELDDLYQREGIEKKRRMDVEDERDALRAEVAALQERLRASIARGDFAQMEVAALKSQTPKHPVKVGEWVRRTKKCAHFGHVAKVLAFIEPCSYEVQCIEGRGIWYFHNCEPCDTPEATHAEPDLTQLHAKGKEAWSDVPNATQWVEEMRGNSEATHDTVQGKAAAESAAQHSAGIDIGTWSRKVTT